MEEKAKENKVVRGWSLSAGNVRWLKRRALELSTAESRLSESQFLDNLITLARAKQEFAKSKEKK